MKKRLLSLVLALAMVVSLFAGMGMTASAAIPNPGSSEDGGTPPPPTSETPEAIPVDETIGLYEYPNDEFYVENLDDEDEDTHWRYVYMTADEGDAYLETLKSAIRGAFTAHEDSVEITGEYIPYERYSNEHDRLVLLKVLNPYDANNPTYVVQSYAYFKLGDEIDNIKVTVNAEAIPEMIPGQALVQGDDWSAFGTFMGNVISFVDGENQYLKMEESGVMDLVAKAPGGAWEAVNPKDPIQAGRTYGVLVRTSAYAAPVNDNGSAYYWAYFAGRGDDVTVTCTGGNYNVVRADATLGDITDAGAAYAFIVELLTTPGNEPGDEPEEEETYTTIQNLKDKGWITYEDDEIIITPQNGASYLVQVVYKNDHGDEPGYGNSEAAKEFMIDPYMGMIDRPIATNTSELTPLVIEQLNSGANAVVDTIAPKTGTTTIPANEQLIFAIVQIDPTVKIDNFYGGGSSAVCYAVKGIYAEEVVVEAASTQVTNVKVLVDEDELPEFTAGDKLLDKMKVQLQAQVCINSEATANDDFRAIIFPAVKVTEDNMASVYAPAFEKLGLDEDSEYDDIMTAIDAYLESMALGEGAPQASVNLDFSWASYYTGDLINGNYALKTDDTLGLVVMLLPPEDTYAEDCTFAVNNGTEKTSEYATIMGNMYTKFFYHELGVVGEAPDEGGDEPVAVVESIKITSYPGGDETLVDGKTLSQATTTGVEWRYKYMSATDGDLYFNNVKDSTSFPVPNDARAIPDSMSIPKVALDNEGNYDGSQDRLMLFEVDNSNNVQSIAYFKLMDPVKDFTLNVTVPDDFTLVAGETLPDPSKITVTVADDDANKVTLNDVVWIAYNSEDKVEWAYAGDTINGDWTYHLGFEFYTKSIDYGTYTGWTYFVDHENIAVTCSGDSFNVDTEAIGEYNNLYYFWPVVEMNFVPEAADEGGDETGNIENLGSDCFSVDEEGNITLNTPTDDGYLYYTLVMPTVALEGSVITAEQYVEYYMEGTEHPIIDVTNPAFDLSDKDAVYPLAHTGTGQVYVTNFAASEENTTLIIDSDSVVAVLKLSADNMVSGAYGAEYFPGLGFTDVYAYGIHGVYADVVEFEGGNSGDEGDEPGDNNKVNNVTVDIDWDKVVYNVEGYPELHPGNVILTPDVAGAIDLEYSYFNWVYYDEAEGGEWYSLEFDDLPDNDPLVGILVYFYPREGYEFGSNPTVSCGDYEVVTEYGDSYEVGVIIKLDGLSTVLPNIKPYTPPTLAAVDIELPQEYTFDAIVNGETLPDLDNLVDMGILSGKFTSEGGDQGGLDYTRAQWMYAPIGSDDIQAAEYDHVANTDENVYYIKITAATWDFDFMVPASFAQGSGINIKNEEGKAYAKSSFEFVYFEEAEDDLKNGLIVVVTPAGDEPPAPPADSGDYIPPTTDIPMSNGDNKMDVEADISGNDVNLKPLDDEQINQLVGKDNANGDVVIDLSDLGRNIDTAGIPKKTLESIVEAAEDAGNKTEHLVIKLSTATLTIDDAAMRAIVDQADGDVVKFNFDDVGLGRLNAAQKEAVKDMDIRKGFEAYITVNGQRVSDFRGGNVEIIVPYAVPAGENVAGFSVWYVDDDGKVEKQKSTYDGKNKWFVVSHFSDYVIVYSKDDADVSKCEKGEICPIHPFGDTNKQAWYHDGVHYCIAAGLMNGISENQFAPNMTTSRAMVVTMLWRMEGSPLVECAEGFNDVYDGDWYNDAIRWATEADIVEGYEGYFNPNDSITREQMATILWRYCKYKGIDVSVGEETNILSYEDAFHVSDWAMEAMQWACGAGVIQGIEKNGTMYLDPQGSAVRSQSATMLYRFCEEVK